VNIYIVRHAESHNNTGGRFCTHTDGGLTTIGELQAEYCRQHLDHIKFDKVYSSHLIRAIRTAQIVGGKEDVIQYKELAELHGGDYESKTWEELDKLDPGFYIKLINALSTIQMPNGESYECVKKRLLEFVNKELINSALNKESNILIVSHGMTLRILINLLMGKSDQDVNSLHWADNTAITHIGLDKEIKLYNLLSNKHLIDNGMDRSSYDRWAGKKHVANKHIEYIDL